jgi:hypothetical protein
MTSTGEKVSNDTISRITDNVVAELSEWHDRPMERSGSSGNGLPPLQGHPAPRGALAEMISHLALESGLDQPLGQLPEQPALAGELQPTSPSPAHQTSKQP